MNGCCADKPYGTGCNDKTCMSLPDGNTCGSCKHFERCNKLFGAESADTNCTFFPRRFRLLATEGC